MWGRFRTIGKFDYVVVMESSGEEELHIYFEFERWLDESPCTEREGWVRVEDGLPKIEDKEGSSVAVLVAWGPSVNNVCSMYYSNDKVRGSLVKRFKWMGRLSPFNVTHWLPLPQPPVTSKNDNNGE